MKLIAVADSKQLYQCLTSTYYIITKLARGTHVASWFSEWRM